MKTRIIAGLCMVPLLLILYWGSLPLAVVGCAIALVGVTEFYNGWEALGVKPSKKIAYVMIGLLYLLHFIVFYGMRGDAFIGSKGISEAIAAEQYGSMFTTQLLNPLLMLWLVLSIVAAMMYGWKINDRGPYDAIATVVGIVYVAFFSYHIVLLDRLPEGRLFTWTVVLAAFGSDIFAYFTGYKFGKHKLAPNLSPKKTIEGAIGGVVGAGVLCGIYGLIFAKAYILQCIFIGIVGGAFSQAGDLTASAFKRKMGIKDYGNLIPGHGGIMDRFDSVIFVAPFVYYLVLLTV